MKPLKRSNLFTEASAYRYAISLLARREYSRQALYSRLTEKGASHEVSIGVLDALRERGYQSDERFIQSLVRIRIAQGKGPIVLYQEAKEHHIPLPLLHTAIQAESPDWFALAVQVLEKRFGSLPENIKEKAKQYRFLMMRGFERDHINAALKA